MSSNEQQNFEQAGGGFGKFNPFGFAFGKTKAASDMRSFEDILKEFNEFFDLDTEKTGKSGKLKARDINVDLDIDFMDSVKGLTKSV